MGTVVEKGVMRQGLWQAFPTFQNIKLGLENQFAACVPVCVYPP
jgi:hypothetical protein